MCIRGRNKDFSTLPTIQTIFEPLLSFLGVSKEKADFVYLFFIESSNLKDDIC